MEKKIKSGAIRDELDKRDLIYEKTLGAGEIITAKEWEDGYDIENVLGIKLNPNDQSSSYSCVGQAFSKYAAVLDFIETKTWDEHSAKAIYSQITLGYGKGAYLRDGAKLIVDWGSIFENIVKSYKNDGTTDETFMIDKSWITPEIIEMAEVLQSKEYRLITGLGIDYFARAIKDGFGMVAGVEGTDNGTWRSTYPVPPTLDTHQNKLWGHAIFCGKFRIKDGKKQIGFLNSWGKIAGENGWQWLGEEWFANDNRFIFNPWVLIDRPNNLINNMVFLKEKNSPNIYAINEEQKLKMLIVDMDSLVALGRITGLGIDFKEVDSLDGYADFGTSVWVDRTIS
jgi:hypothetical protein